MDPAQIFGGESSNSAGGFTPAPATDRPNAPEGGGDKGGEGGEGGQKISDDQMQQALAYALNENKQLGGKLADLEKSGASQAEIINKMKQVFNPDPQDPEADVGKQGEQFLDMVLQAAMESEKAGTGGMPITVQLAAHMVQMQKKFSEQQKVIDSLNGKVKQQTDPRFEIENRAAMNLDTMVGQMVGNIYGKENPHMFQAITGKMLEDIKQLRSSNPAKWMEIARNPEHQKQVAQYYVEQFVPPKAREILHHQKVMDTPMTMQELMEAYQQADEAYKDNPQEGRRIKEKIRHQILEQRYHQAMPGARQ